jgi:hypothetical protein
MKLLASAALGLTSLTTSQWAAAALNTHVKNQPEGASMLHNGTAFQHVAGNTTCGCPFCCNKAVIDGWAPEEVI